MDLEVFRGAGDRQRPGVVGLMTARAGQYDIRCFVAATVGTVDQVMQLEASRRAAAIHPAATAIATPDETRNARRNVLVRPFRRRTVDRSNMLRIAHRAFDRRGGDRDLRAGTLLPALAAALAHRDRNLELRATRGLAGRRAIEHRAA
jgi:hypothetical protein